MLDSFNNDPSLNEANRRLVARGQDPVTPVTPSSVVVQKNNNNEARKPQGPTAKLATTPYAAQDLRFPTDVAINPGNRHWIKFTPLVRTGGKYEVKTSRQAGPGVSAGATPNEIPGLGAVSGGLAGLVAADRILSGDFSELRDTAAAADPTLSPSDRIAAGGRLASAISSAVGQLGLASAIVSGINLSRQTKRAAGFICLYMPDTVNFTTVNDYDTISLTSALGKVGMAAAAGGSLKDLVTRKDINLTSGGSAGLREAAGFLGEQTGLFGAGITDALLFSAGVAQNPQMEVLFKATRNREFLFDFKFTAKDESESNTIKNIIKKFRFHAAPDLPTTGGTRYLVPPDEFDIEFMYGNKAHPYLPKIASCALEGIDVNYASSGQWATFRGGAPVEISMQLRFKEVEILYKERIDQGF